jgi:hypothetical protein
MESEPLPGAFVPAAADLRVVRIFRGYGTSCGESGCACRDPIEENTMGKGLILWMLGVPGIIVIALLVTHVI